MKMRSQITPTRIATASLGAVVKFEKEESIEKIGREWNARTRMPVKVVEVATGSVSGAATGAEIGKFCGWMCACGIGGLVGTTLGAVFGGLVTLYAVWTPSPLSATPGTDSPASVRDLTLEPIMIPVSASPAARPKLQLHFNTIINHTSLDPGFDSGFDSDSDYETCSSDDSSTPVPPPRRHRQKVSKRAVEAH